MGNKNAIMNISETDLVLNENNFIYINRSKSGIFFEIGNQITEDVAEAVSILMNRISSDDVIWKTKLDENFDYPITSKKCLYWLTGGNEEWNNLNNYKKPWYIFYNNFCENFEDGIIECVDNAKTLGDIRDYFNNYLNLPKLYDYAISVNLIK